MVSYVEYNMGVRGCLRLSTQGDAISVNAGLRCDCSDLAGSTHRELRRADEIGVTKKQEVTMGEQRFQGLEEHFGDLPEPQLVGRCDHNLLDIIIIIAICAVLCGSESGLHLFEDQRPDSGRTSGRTCCAAHLTQPRGCWGPKRSGLENGQFRRGLPSRKAQFTTRAA